MSRFVVLGLCALAGCAEQAPPPLAPPIPAPVAQPEPNPEIPDIETVKEMVQQTIWVCGNAPPPDRTAVKALGERAFPAFEQILGDPKSELFLTCQTLSFVAELKAERRFVPFVVRRMAPDANLNIDQTVCGIIASRASWANKADPLILFDLALECAHAGTTQRGWLRAEAVRCLGSLGDERDAIVLRPLLTDEWIGVRYEAAEMLAKIGLNADLDAMDGWLKGKDPRKDADEQQHFQKCRDELDARLKAHPIPKNALN